MDTVVIGLVSDSGTLTDVVRAIHEAFESEDATVIRDWQPAETCYVVITGAIDPAVLETVASEAPGRVTGQARLAATGEPTRGLAEMLPEHIEYDLQLPAATPGAPQAAILPELFVCHRCFGVGRHIGPPCMMPVRDTTALHVQ